MTPAPQKTKTRRNTKHSDEHDEPDNPEKEERKQEPSRIMVKGQRNPQAKTEAGTELGGKHKSKGPNILANGETERLQESPKRKKIMIPNNGGLFRPGTCRAETLKSVTDRCSASGERPKT